MPTIEVTALLENWGAAEPLPMAMQHDWEVNLAFTGANCKFSRNRRIEHPTINATTLTNKFTLPFSQVRGGDLTIEVTVRIGDSMRSTVTGRSRG